MSMVVLITRRRTQVTAVTEVSRTLQGPSRQTAGADAPATIRPQRRPRYAAGFWLAAVAFLAAMAFSTIPTPLYVLYQQRDGFSSFVVTVVFAVYAVGVIASLLLAGHISDWVGRRRVLVPALAMEDANLTVFLIGGGLAGAGAGVLFKWALAAYVGAAEPAKRGEAASSLFLFAYLGLIIPVLGIGVSTLFVSAQTAMLLFTGALLVILSATATLALRRPNRGFGPLDVAATRLELGATASAGSPPVSRRAE